MQSIDLVPPSPRQALQTCRHCAPSASNSWLSRTPCAGRSYAVNLPCVPPPPVCLTYLQDELRAIRKQQLAEQEALRREEELLAADPFDPDAQRKIEELINKRNIEENFAAVGIAVMGWVWGGGGCC